MDLRRLTFCALFVALITVGTFIRIPIAGSVYTLQFLFTLLAGLILGAGLGMTSVAVYVLMGLLGVPVFAMGGGPSYLLQPTFGYLLGFAVQAYFCGYFSRNRGTGNFLHLLTVNLGGMLLVYAFGIAWFYVVSNYIIDAPISAWAALFYCGIVQAPPDIVLCIAAAKLAQRCRQAGIWLA